MHKIRSYTQSFEAHSGLYFVQDENNFITLLLQVGSGSTSNEKVPDLAGQNINGSDRTRILIPAYRYLLLTENMIVFDAGLFFLNFNWCTFLRWSLWLILLLCRGCWSSSWLSQTPISTHFKIQIFVFYYRWHSFVSCP